MSFEDLKSSFARVGLELKAAKEPFGRGAVDVFGMSIGRSARGNRREEWFIVWCGHEANRIEVVGVDKDLRQVVLMVHEPVRTFEEAVPYVTLKHQQQRHGENWLEQLLKEHRLTKRDVVSASNDRVVVRRRTSNRKRHYLCGVDERQLFIAELPKAVSTVRDAHACLKSTQVTLAEGIVPGKTLRQGEWFLLPITPEQRRHLEGALRSKRVWIDKKLPIGAAFSNNRRQPGGNPHVPDELVILPAETTKSGFPVQARPDVFVRGSIRHVDHATVRLKDWHRVIRNAEPNAGRMEGIAWID